MLLPIRARKSDMRTCYCFFGPPILSSSSQIAHALGRAEAWCRILSILGCIRILIWVVLRVTRRRVWLCLLGWCTSRSRRIPAILRIRRWDAVCSWWIFCVDISSTTSIYVWWLSRGYLSLISMFPIARMSPVVRVVSSMGRRRWVNSVLLLFESGGFFFETSLFFLVLRMFMDYVAGSNKL